jgi:hypothetical protein
MPPSWQRGAGALLLVLWLCMAGQKAQAGVLAELWWLCHVSSLLLALGLLGQWRMLSATAMLLQLTLGLPFYVGYLAQGGHSHWASQALHALAPLFGVLVWWRQRLPAATAWLALGTALLLWPASLWWTAAGMNVNLAFAPLMVWPTMGAGVNRGLNLLLLAGALAGGRVGWNWLAMGIWRSKT